MGLNVDHKKNNPYGTQDRDTQCSTQPLRELYIYFKCYFCPQLNYVRYT